MDRRIAFILALGLVGCTSTETVYLINESGARVTCGPYDHGQFKDTRVTAEASLRNCVEDFQRAGYDRVEGPE